jgi:hypothetical protein
MGVRSHFWIAGVLVGLLLAWAIPTPGVLPSRAAAFLIGLSSIGLLGEWFSSRPARPAGESTTLPADTRPPDGIVGLIPVEGVLSEPNEDRPRLGAFRALEARSGSHPPPGPGMPRLLGRVAVFSLFIGRDGRPWSDAEIVRAHATIERAKNTTATLMILDLSSPRCSIRVIRNSSRGPRRREGILRRPAI